MNAWRLRGAAIGLALFALFAPEITAQRPERPNGARRAAGPGLDRAELAKAREIGQALRRLAEAVEAEEARLRAKATPVDRPEKTITPPTLTSAELDALILETLDAAGAEPASPAEDETFLRRVFLDLTGAPPTPERIAAFLADEDPDKRARIIDELLESEEYATNWARHWRDVIRYRASFENRRLVDYRALESWLKDQFAENRPWDAIASELIAGTGTPDENGAIVFATAHLDGRRTVSAPEFSGEVSRIFLGIQIQCAQCHDHPTDPWTRRQFHEFASFFAGTNARRVGRPQDPDYRFEVLGSGRVPRYTMPDLEDPANSIPVAPKFFLADEAEEIPVGLTGQERRELAASYVTGQDNPWFARAFVNRIWYELFGEAFYLPIDDLGPTRDPYAKEVIDRLAEEWSAGGYDIAWLFRTILNTEAYQRRSVSSESSAAQAPFAANCPSRLSPDQITDALDRALGVFSALERRAAGQGPQAMRRARFGPRLLIDDLFGVDPSTPDDEVLGTIPQALFLMNNRLLHAAIANPRGVLGGILAEHRNDPQALEALYLRVLARTPNARETELCLDYIEQVGDRREAFEDILWSLINSSEFISRY